MFFFVFAAGWMGGHPPPRFLCYLHLPRWRGDRVGNSDSKIPKQDLNVGWMFESLTLRILYMLSSMNINVYILSTCILPPQIPTCSASTEVLVGGGAPPVDPDVVTKLPRAPPPGMNPDTVEAPKVAPQNQGHHGGIMVRGCPDFGI